MQIDDNLRRDIQIEALKILKEFIRVCDRLGLVYYVAYGTLLGAIRHEGFIPWDDDIDVYMPRKDYDAFVSCAQSLLAPNFFVQTADTDPEVLYAYAKIRNSDTTYIENINRNKAINHGIFIDVFPLDDLPACSFYAKLKTYLFTVQKTRTQYAMEESGSCKNVELKDRIKKTIIMLMYPSAKRALRKQMRVKHFNSSDKYVVYQFARYNMRGICMKSWFSDGVQKPFEDITVRVPAEYEKVLTVVYGDYRKLPPLQERKTSHDCYIIDTKRSYRQYIGRGNE